MSTVVCALLSQTKRTPPLVGLVAALVGLVAGVHAAAAGAAANLTEPPEPPEAPEAREAPEAAPSLVAADATAAAPAFSGERELLALTAFARAVELDLALALFFPLTLPDEGADNILLRRSREIDGDRVRSREIKGADNIGPEATMAIDQSATQGRSREINGPKATMAIDGAQRQSAYPLSWRGAGRGARASQRKR